MIKSQINGEPDFLEVGIDAELKVVVRVRRGYEEEDLARARQRMTECLRSVTNGDREDTGPVHIYLGSFR